MSNQGSECTVDITDRLDGLFDYSDLSDLDEERLGGVDLNLKFKSNTPILAE